MLRSDIINYCIKKNNYKSYLEIGLSDPSNNFIHINCEEKESVDPYNESYRELDVDWELVIKNITYRMTSDKLFSILPENKKYDFIFIDGLHEYRQVARDIINSFKHLNKGGIIMLHDTIPESYETTIDSEPGGIWYGDVYKTAIQLEKFVPWFYSVNKQSDCDEVGLTIIKYFDGCDKITFEPEDISYEYFEKNKDKLRILPLNDVLFLMTEYNPQS